MSNATNWLKELAEPRKGGEYVKEAIARAARLSGLSYWRAFDVWYRKGNPATPNEIQKIANALGAKNERDARDDLQKCKTILARLEAQLVSKPTDFHSPSVAEANKAVRQMHHVAGAMARRGCT